MAKVNEKGATDNVAGLEKQLVEARANVETLAAQRAELVRERAQLESGAARSLADVALDKLRGQAQRQAEQKTKAEALSLTIGEVTRRLTEARGVVAQLETEVKAAKVAATQTDIDATEAKIAALLREAADLAEKNMALAQSVAFVPADSHIANGLQHLGATRPALAFSGAHVRDLEALIRVYGEAYERRNRKQAPVVYKVPTTAGLQPARALAR